MKSWCWRPGPLRSCRNHGLPSRTWSFPGKDLLGKPDSKTDSLLAKDSGKELSDKSSFWFDMHSGEEGQGVGADEENQDQQGQWIQATNTEGCRCENCLACTRAGTLPPPPIWNAFSIFTETVLFSLKYLMYLWTKNIWKTWSLKPKQARHSESVILYKLDLGRLERHVWYYAYLSTQTLRMCITVVHILWVYAHTQHFYFIQDTTVSWNTRLCLVVPPLF